MQLSFSLGIAFAAVHSRAGKQEEILKPHQEKRWMEELEVRNNGHGGTDRNSLRKSHHSLVALPCNDW
jgi:hypothetical protein